MKIQSTETIEQGAVRIVVYGQNKIGKTTLAKTLNGKTLILSLEKGLLSLRGTKIDYCDLTVDDNGKPFATAKDKFEHIAASIKSPKLNEYDNIVFDTLTQFGYIVESFIKETESAETLKNKYHVFGRIGEITVALINYINENIKANFIMLMQEELSRDEEQRMFWGPDYPGKMSMGTIIGLFDEIYRLTVESDGRRVLLTQAGVRHKAGSRGAGQGIIKPVESADLGAIIKKIKDKSEAPVKPQGVSK